MGELDRDRRSITSRSLLDDLLSIVRYLFATFLCEGEQGILDVNLHCCLEMRIMSSNGRDCGDSPR